VSNRKKLNFFIHESSYLDKTAKIGDNTKIWHFSNIQSKAIIGKNCSIGQNVNIGNNVVIGNSVKIQNNVSVYEGVELEDYVFCGPSMVFTNVKLPRSEFPQKGSKFYSKTLVKKSASIGANATIICGVTIGEYALIGSGTVVTKDVPSFSLLVGNPGKVIGWVDRYGSRLIFDNDNIAKCSRTGELYKLQNDKLLSIEK
tara:strand:- start:76 stop:675 length:600 start_codon:yes stop_codon:yes gene_type:complete